MSAFGATSQKVNGVFRAEDVKLTFGTGSEGMIVQSVQFTCNRTVNFLYEIGSQNVYYVGDRRQGQAQLARVVGGAGNFTALINQYGNICDPKDIKLEVTGTDGGVLCNSGGVKYILKFATLSSVGINMTAQEIVINEQLGFIFTDLDI